MLPPFIIEQIREREEKQRRDEQVQPVVELPFAPFPARESQEREESDRGIVIIDVMGE